MKNKRLGRLGSYPHCRVGVFFMDLQFFGGRGSSSGDKKFKFANGGDLKNGSIAKDLLPAIANTKITTKTPEAALRSFQKEHSNSKTEFAYVIDNQGFVYNYLQAGKNAVGLSPKVMNSLGGKTVIHNHPSGSAFSKADLSTFADSKMDSIVAVGKNSYTYQVSKGTHFRKQEFNHAMKNATLQGKDYNDAVHKWLSNKENQKQFGYNYKRTKTIS